MKKKKRFKYIKAYFSPRKNAKDNIVGFIRRTKKSLDIAMYSFTSKSIANVILRAMERGVRIRVVVDKQQAGGRYSEVKRLQSYGVDIRIDREGGLMHNKYVISDFDCQRSAVMTGSYNFTEGAERRNRENFIIVRVKSKRNRLREVIQQFQKDFEEVWKANKPKKGK